MQKSLLFSIEQTITRYDFTARFAISNSETDIASGADHSQIILPHRIHA